MFTQTKLVNTSFTSPNYPFVVAAATWRTVKIYSHNNTQVYQTVLSTIFSLPHALLACSSLCWEHRTRHFTCFLAIRLTFFQQKDGQRWWWGQNSQKNRETTGYRWILQWDYRFLRPFLLLWVTQRPLRAEQVELTGRAGRRSLQGRTPRDPILMKNGRVVNIKRCKPHEQVKKCSNFL